MSIFNDLLAFVDDKLEAVYNHKAYDPSADRARVAKRVMAQKEKFASATPVKGSKDYSILNGIVRYEPKLPNGSPLKLGTKSAPFHIPSEKFDTFLTKLHSVIVDQKGIDDQLSATPTGDKPARAPRKASTGGTGGAGWSQARRDRFSATVAARRAKTAE